MPPCLTLSIIRYGSKVKWSNPGKRVAPSPTHWSSSYWKGSLRAPLDYGRQLYIYIYIYIYIYSAFPIGKQDITTLHIGNLKTVQKETLDSCDISFANKKRWTPNSYLLPSIKYAYKKTCYLNTHIYRESPVSWGCRIDWLHLCREVRPHPYPKDMTLNNLTVRLQ